jgi:hypothetical protein
MEQGKEASVRLDLIAMSRVADKAPRIAGSLAMGCLGL